MENNTTTKLAAPLTKRPYANNSPRTLKQLERDLKAIGFCCFQAEKGLVIGGDGAGKTRVQVALDYLGRYSYWYGIAYQNQLCDSLVVANPKSEFCYSPAQIQHEINEALRCNDAIDDTTVFVEGTRVWVEITEITTEILKGLRRHVDVKIVSAPFSKSEGWSEIYVVRSKNGVQF